MNPVLFLPFFIYFLIAAALAFYVPGRVVLGKQKLSMLGIAACSVVLGIVLFAAQGFLFGYLQARFLTYLYLVIFLGLFVSKKYYKEFLSVKFKFANLDLFSLAIMAAGVCAQMLPYITVGLKTSAGIILPSHNAPDHIWHATLIDELVRRFPPHEPAISGVMLTDYHYWFNLATAELIRIFHLPLFFTQFTGMYVLASVLLGVVIYLFGMLVYPSKMFIRWLFFFFYFGGDAAGWMVLVLQHTFNWDVASLITNSAKFLESPPFSYSMIVLFTGLFLLFQEKKLSVKTIVLCSLLFGSLVAFKIHTGIVVLGGLGFFVLMRFLKKDVRSLFVLLGAGALAGTLFLKVSSSGGGLFFLPVDIPRDFINQPILGLVDWQLKWVIFQEHHNILRLIQYGFYMSAVYFLTQFGVLVFGLLPLKKTISILTLEKAVFFYGAIIVSFVIGLFFYQKVGGANIWEVFLPSIYLLSFLTALHITVLLQKKNKTLQLIVTVVIVLFVIPRFLLTINEYINEVYLSGFTGVTNGELASYDFIKNKTPKNSLILITNQHTYQIYSWYASIFMQRDLFFSGNGVRQVDTPLIKYRRDVVRAVTNSNNAEDITNDLEVNHISYVYFYNPMRFGVDVGNLPVHSVFSNKSATIFKVN